VTPGKTLDFFRTASKGPSAWNRVKAKIRVRCQFFCQGGLARQGAVVRVSPNSKISMNEYCDGIVFTVFIEELIATLASIKNENAP
jgi:hypothetical protein